MARSLASEKPFLVIVPEIEYTDSRYHGIIVSYSILNSTFITLTDTFPSYDNYGTVIHIDTEENIQKVLPTIPSGIRYFGYVNVTERIISNSIAYIGIPVILSDKSTKPNMWNVVYPHITLIPPSNVTECVNLVGHPIHYKLSKDIIQTANTMSYSVLIADEDYHITCCVANGKSPSIAKKEMIGKKGKEYISMIGYPVIM